MALSKLVHTGSTSRVASLHSTLNSLFAFTAVAIHRDPGHVVLYCSAFSVFVSHIFLLVNLTYYYLILGWQSQVPKVSLLLPCCIILADSMSSTINNRCNPYLTFKASFVTSYFVLTFKVQGNVKTPAYMYAENNI